MVTEENSGRLQKPLKHRRAPKMGGAPVLRWESNGMARLGLSAFLIIAYAAAPAAPASAMARCPDGTYVGGGSCKQAPDGSYISGSGRPQLAPNGKYTSGKPVLTPKGDYITGQGRMTRCSDGTYVMGKCKLAPNGKYIGE
jgi:hypothetical protein